MSGILITSIGKFVKSQNSRTHPRSLQERSHDQQTNGGNPTTLDWTENGDWSKFLFGNNWWNIREISAGLPQSGITPTWRVTSSATTFRSFGVRMRAGANGSANIFHWLLAGSLRSSQGSEPVPRQAPLLQRI